MRVVALAFVFFLALTACAPQQESPPVPVPDPVVVQEQAVQEEPVPQASAALTLSELQAKVRKAASGSVIVFLANKTPGDRDPSVKVLDGRVQFTGSPNADILMLLDPTEMATEGTAKALTALRAEKTKEQLAAISSVKYETQTFQYSLEAVELDSGQVFEYAASARATNGQGDFVAPYGQIVVYVPCGEKAFVAFHPKKTSVMSTTWKGYNEADYDQATKDMLSTDRFNARQQANAFIALC